MRIGLTGGIATGKSTVSRMLQTRGAAIVDADQVAREVVEPHTPGWRRIRERFGDRILRPDGYLDRKALRDVVFRDPQARRDLNGILHPLIRERMLEQAKFLERERPGRVIVFDIPLLYESRLTDWVEKVIVVYVPESVQIRRLMEREGIGEEEALRMVRAQMPIEEKKRMADCLIDNSGSLEETERQVDHLWRCLTSENGSSPQ
ncbi:dephospho-CoA kinase [Planifilum fimeticola]|jgi:dephospho-CoA kinase|uniref:Dephospho-CoA kinase n=1 Tax=Planifilum fimeticola TaxID=201975 RepID=A0A2T0LIH3_9BACL|nr:dephospho-CoA kinase [Planifilum fimeticola]PRX42256.1 dephospho-CoA kinase [Planifilum fimeticola]